MRVAAGDKLPSEARRFSRQQPENGEKVVMRKAMRNTIFGTALVAGLLATGAAANAQRPGFYGRGYEHPIARGGFVHEGWVRPVGPAYPVAPAYGFGVTIGAPVADTYIPPCPGDGYDWVAGYYNGGVWVPGAWRMRAGYRVGFVDHGYGHGYGRGFEHRGFYGGRR
jgi:hypothetical protein